jgi:hypothetical protein
MGDKDAFDHMWFSGRHGGWVTERRTNGQWGVVLVSSLVGSTVNLGTKDGLVYDSARVTAFDEREGSLTLEGGSTGNPWREDDLPVQMTEPDYVWVHDVARGYVHRGDDL